MADDLAVEIGNEAEVLRQLEKAGLVVRDVLEEAALEGAEVFREAAEDRAPGPYIKKKVALKRKAKVRVDVGPKSEYTPVVPSEGFIARVDQIATDGVLEANRIADKHEREMVIEEIMDQVRSETEEEYPDEQRFVWDVTHEIQKKDMRKTLLESGIRSDGRQPDEIRT